MRRTRRGKLLMHDGWHDRVTGRVIIVLAMLCALTAVAAFFSRAYAAEVLPGAVRDVPASAAATADLQQAGQKTSRASVYTTASDFEVAVTHYRKIGKAIELPEPLKTGTKLPDGRTVRYFWCTLDGAATIAKSKRWVSIQKPFVGGVHFEGLKPVYTDIRDLTAITITESESGSLGKGK